MSYDIAEREEHGGELVAQSPTTLALLARAEIDVQISTAKAFPRSLKAFQTRAHGMACLDEVTALACIYSLPRGGKPIEGPSVRLAEIVAASYGNIRYGARVVDEGEKFVTAQGICHDLETNVSATIEVQRRITGKNGKRFNDDMVGVTGNAAAAIAKRNAIFTVVPKALWIGVYNAARATSLGDVKTLTRRRDDCFSYLQKLGVPLKNSLAVVSRPAIEDVNLEDLAALRALCEAVKAKELTIEQAFPNPEPEPKPPTELPVGRSSTKANGTPAPVAPPAPAVPPADVKPPATTPPEEPLPWQREAEPEKPAQQTPSDDQGGLADAVDSFNEQLEAAQTVQHFDAIEADLTRQKGSLGGHYEGLLKRLQTARAKLTAGKGKPR